MEFVFQLTTTLQSGLVDGNRLGLVFGGLRVRVLGSGFRLRLKLMVRFQG